MKACVVLAGGHSVSLNNRAWLNSDTRRLLTNAETICVNDAVRSIDEPSCVVTMDRKWLENRYDEVHARGVQIFYRSCTLRGPIAERLDQYKHIAFHNSNKPGPMMGHTVPLTLNGANSGACALNLAYVRGYHTVFLLGFDMQKGPNGENHFYPDYEWNKNCTKPPTLQSWAGHFEDAAKQFASRGTAVFNVNDRSRIKNFPVISFEEFARRLS